METHDADSNRLPDTATIAAVAEAVLPNDQQLANQFIKACHDVHIHTCGALRMFRSTSLLISSIIPDDDLLGTLKREGLLASIQVGTQPHTT
jgi:hypothetical protein